MLAAASAYYKDQTLEHGSNSLVAALTRGVEAIKLYGGAQLGDATMLDVWVPVLHQLSKDVKRQISLSTLLQRAAELAKSCAVDVSHSSLSYVSHWLFRQLP